MYGFIFRRRSQGHPADHRSPKATALTLATCASAAFAMLALPTTNAIARSFGPAQPPERSLQAIYMISPTTGFGLFESGLGPSTCRSWVARTTDRGRIFSAPVVVNTWGRCQFVGFDERITANPEGDVAVWGNGLFESHDNGRTWARVAIPATVEQVSFQGESAWLARENCRTTFQLTCPVTLDLSRNGGRTWTVDAAQPPGVVAANGWETQTTTILLRVTSTVGYVFTGPRSESYQDNVLPVWRTTDGGRSWQARHTRCAVGPAYGIPFAAATHAGAIYLLCTGIGDRGDEVKSTSVSYDGARTWRVVNPASTLDNPMTVGYWSSIAALSDTTAFSTGERANLWFTHNAGRTWTSLPYGIGAGNPQQVLFVNPVDGFMLASSSISTEWIYYTVNGGSSWTKVAPSVE
jgi:photosystem II stability/assembly factor-like uncharacterized protein